jgi:PAS domain S-box-containing protein
MNSFFGVPEMADKPTYEALEQRLRELEQAQEDLQRTEAKLRESQSKLQEAQKLVGLGYWTWDIATGKVVWSDEVYRIFGRNPEEFETTIDSILSLSPWPEERQRGQELLQKAMENHEKGEYDQKFLYPDGSVGYYHSTFLGNYDSKDKLVSMAGTVMDITKRKQAEEALKQSEERYRSLVENTLDGYFIFEIPSGRLIFVNQRLCNIFQYSMDEAMTLAIWKIIDSQHHDLIQKHIQDSHGNAKFVAEPYTFDAICKDGQKVRVEMSLSMVHYQGNNVMQGVMRDVTERERLHRQIQQAQKMESIGRLAGGVAHDFNNMLSVIVGQTEIMLLSAKPECPTYHSLKEIHSAALRSSDLTRQLLAFARRQTIAPKILDLNKNIETTFKLLKRIIGENIKLLWNPDENIWPVRIDPSQVDQLLINLCLNARDAIAASGTITIETANTVIDSTYCKKHMEFRPGNWVQLTVSDDGCGIDEENQRLIFEPFFSTKELGKGTGLGLATVYGIVKQNKGFVYVYSEPDLGTTFKIYLPQVLDTITKEEALKPKKHPKGCETILLVEDEGSILDVGKVVLERFGYSVLTALSPKEALKIAQSWDDPIHLLITDVVMPEMNGRELQTHLEKIKPGIKVLFMSGYTSNVIVHRGVLEENVNFLQKPFSIDTLSTKVREVLDHDELSPGSKS